MPLAISRPPSLRTRADRRGEGRGLGQRLAARFQTLFDLLCKPFQRGAKLAQALARARIRRIEARRDERREILIAFGQALIERAAALDNRLLDRKQLAVDERGERRDLGFDARDSLLASLHDRGLEHSEAILHRALDGARV